MRGTCLKVGLPLKRPEENWSTSNRIILTSKSCPEVLSITKELNLVPTL